MEFIQDFKWKKGITVKELVEGYRNLGYQSIELKRASEVIVRMKKNNAKIFLTFTSNMVTSGLRGFFAQLIKLRMADVIVTTVGGIEEDIMKASGERFKIGSFSSDDVELHEKGVNRIGNILVNNESYMKFEDMLREMLDKLYAKQKRWAVSSLLKEIGLMLNDKDSVLYQAAKNDVPIFCPAITDGAFGFHLYLYQKKHPDFIIDVVKDFGNILFVTSHDEKKGVVALGGSISKHHAILSTLLNGGANYAVYMTTAHKTSGSMSGATTEEAKSWGKVQDAADIATVIGDVTITFPLAMINAMEQLSDEGLLVELELRPHHIESFRDFEKGEHYKLSDEDYINEFRKKSSVHSDEFAISWRDFLKKLHDNPKLKFRYVSGEDSVCVECDELDKCRDDRESLRSNVEKLDARAVEAFPLLEFGNVYDVRFLRKLFSENAKG